MLSVGELHARRSAGNFDTSVRYGTDPVVVPMEPAAAL